jgi:Uma2 family endonuclease
MTVSERNMTVEEFLELPNEEPPLEFEDGMVSQKVSPKAQHARLQSRFVELINPSTVDRKIAVAFTELRATFGGRSYVPDVAILQWDRIPVNTVGRLTNDIFEAPDIAIEIVSPGQSVTSLVGRCIWYVDNGVRIAILVDPDDEAVVQFKPGQAPVVLGGDDPIPFDQVLGDLRLTIRELFSSLYYR